MHLSAASPVSIMGQSNRIWLVLLIGFAKLLSTFTLVAATDGGDSIAMLSSAFSSDDDAPPHQMQQQAKAGQEGSKDGKHNSPILDVNLTIVDSPMQNFTNQKPHWPQPSPIPYNKTEPERKSTLSII